MILFIHMIYIYRRVSKVSKARSFQKPNLCPKSFIHVPKVLHNRQLHSSPYHFLMRSLKMEIFDDGLASFESPCHSLHRKKAITSIPNRTVRAKGICNRTFLGDKGDFSQ